MTRPGRLLSVRSVAAHLGVVRPESLNHGDARGAGAEDVEAARESRKPASAATASATGTPAACAPAMAASAFDRLCMPGWRSLSG